MTLTTFGIVFLIGATLSLRFKFLILLPAIGLAVVGTAVVGIAHADRVGAVVLTIVLTAAALQIGYVFGVVTRTVIASFSVPQRRAVMVEKLGHR
jgi:ABC-type sulfate transport system permease subunit